MAHTLEELRSAALEAFASDHAGRREISQYSDLKIAVGRVLRRRDGQPEALPTQYPADNALDPDDANALLEVFWDLFRDGVITLGSDRHNEKFPFFRLTSRGVRALEGDNAYFLYDLSAFEVRVRSRIPTIDAATLTYLKEAVHAFRSSCILSSAVMLGVAAEHTFLRLLQSIGDNPSIAAQYASIGNEPSLLRKINKFKNKVLQEKTSLPNSLLEDFDTNFLALQSLIRVFRNESGHPTGQLLEREQAFVNIQLFIPYCEKAYEMIEHFRNVK